MRFDNTYGLVAPWLPLGAAGMALIARGRGERVRPGYAQHKPSVPTDAGWPQGASAVLLPGADLVIARGHGGRSSVVARPTATVASFKSFCRGLGGAM